MVFYANKFDIFVFGVEDKYKYALSLARGGDVEIVCLTYTKLARLYLKVYTDGIHRTKARETLNDVMNYSKVIGRNLYQTDWYREAASMLREVQEAAMNHGLLVGLRCLLNSKLATRHLNLNLK